MTDAILTIDESPAARAQRMQTEANALAAEAYRDLLATLEAAVSQCGGVAALEALPAGVRDEARRLAPNIEKAVAHMTAIRARV